jgi:hypothetical protein
MNVSEIEVALTEYIKQYVISQIPDSFARFGYLLSVRIALPPLIQKYVPMLEKSGIITNGVVDLDKLKSIMESTFKDVPKFQIADFGFSAADLPQFINFLKNGTPGNNSQR